MPEPKNEVQDIADQYEYIKECEEDEEGYYWTIEAADNVTKENSIDNKHTVAAIGTVSLFEINSHHKNVQLGILIGDKSYGGKGGGD